ASRYSLRSPTRRGALCSRASPTAAPPPPRSSRPSCRSAARPCSSTSRRYARPSWSRAHARAARCSTRSPPSRSLTPWAGSPTRDFAANTVEVRTKSGLRRNPKDERSFYLTSSCGVCGKGALEFVRQEAPASRHKPSVTAELVLSAPSAVRSRQSAFDRTGGLHATGLFEASGELLVVREDVGRHNAMDKAIGALLLGGRFPLDGVFATVSGRASFELVQKASLASLIGVVAVGPPSTLAVDLARERGMLLCGFVRQGSLNVYAGSELLTG